MPSLLIQHGDDERTIELLLTFLHRCMLLLRLPRLAFPFLTFRLTQGNEMGFGDCTDAAGDARGPVGERGEVDVHETEDHVVRDVWDVVGDHVRGVVNLGRGWDEC